MLVMSLRCHIDVAKLASSPEEFHGMRIFQLILVLLAVLAPLAGCGGGGASSASDPIAAYVASATRAYSNRDLAGIDRAYSNDYLFNCETKLDIMGAANALFTDPEIRSLEMKAIDISNKWVSDASGLAYAKVRLQVNTRYTDGYLDSYVAELELHLVRENGAWRQIGNQLCSRAPQAEGTPKEEKLPLFGIKRTR